MGAGGWEAAWKPIWLSSFFSDSPLKNMMDGNLVFPCPPDDIINKRTYPTLDLLWVRVLLRWNGRWMTGGSAESHLIVMHLFYSPLKNIIGQKNSLSALPWWYHLKRSVPDIRLAVGNRSIMSEWAPEDNGQRERAWWTAPMVSVLWKYRVVSDVHIFQSGWCWCFRSQNSDASL
jgi:hypothetical protein